MHTSNSRTLMGRAAWVGRWGIAWAVFLGGLAGAAQAADLLVADGGGQVGQTVALSVTFNDPAGTVRGLDLTFETTPTASLTLVDATAGTAVPAGALFARSFPGNGRLQVIILSLSGVLPAGEMVKLRARLDVAGSAQVQLARVSTTPTTTVTTTPGTVIITPINNPPTITTHPTNQTVTEGQPATFSVVASGTAPLSYQWQKNGSEISSATSASYTTPATTLADHGALYHVVVSNAVGSAPSTAATLSVNPASVPPSVVITAPTAGAALTGTTVEVDYQGQGSFVAAGVTHAHLQLDTDPEVRDFGFDLATGVGRYSFMSVPVGAHTVRVYLADATHAQVGTDATVAFTTAALNRPPVANAGSAQTVTDGQIVTLDASGSTDPDGDPLTYQWTQTSGPGVSLTNATSAQASFTAPPVAGVTTVDFDVTVQDPGGLLDRASVTITIQPIVPGPSLTIDSASGQVGQDLLVGVTFTDPRGTIRGLNLEFAGSPANLLSLVDATAGPAVPSGALFAASLLPNGHLQVLILSTSGALASGTLCQVQVHLDQAGSGQLELVKAIPTPAATLTLTPGAVTITGSGPRNRPPVRPHTPQPADNDKNQPLALTLSWKSSDPDGDPIQYDLFFEATTGSPTTKIAQGLSANQMAVGPLQPQTAYAWQVIADDGKGGVTPGPIWRFQTTTGGGGDTVPPTIATQNPAANALYVSPNTNILLRITDDNSGVDPATVNLVVDGQAVITAGQVQPGMKARLAPSSRKAGDLMMLYNPATLFAYERQVAVHVELSDRAGNALAAGDQDYSFTIMPFSFSPPRPVVPARSGIVVSAPNIAVSPDGEHVVLAWNELDAANQRATIVTSHSRNRGGNFASPTTLASVASSSSITLGRPDIAFDDPHVAVAWSQFTPSNATASQGGEVWFARSDDGGATFAPAQRLAATQGVGEVRCHLATVSPAVAVVWNDPGRQSVLLAQSHDDGATFDADTRVDDGTGASPRDPVVNLLNAGSVFVSWLADVGTPPTPHAFADWTHQKGRFTTSLLLDPGAATGVDMDVDPVSVTPSIVLTTANRVIVKSIDVSLGAVLPAVTVDDATSGVVSLERAVLANNAKGMVTTCWVDRRQAQLAGDTDIYCGTSYDGGGSFTTNILANSGDPAAQNQPSVAMNDQGTLYLVYVDPQGGNPTVMFTKDVTQIPVATGTVSAATGAQVAVPTGNALAGAQVNVPPDALEVDWQLTIAQAEWVSRNGLPSGVTPVGEVVALGPGGTQFAIPVSVCIPFDSNEVTSLGLSSSTLKLYRLVEPLSIINPVWEELASTVNLSARTVCAPTEHFSIFGIGGIVGAILGGGGGAVAAGGGGGGGGGVIESLFGGGGGGGGGCYVVSSAFGSARDPEVQTLMQVRWRYLEPNPIGAKLVAFYEAVGPSWARFLDQHPWLKPSVRSMVRPIVSCCRLLMNTRRNP